MRITDQTVVLSTPMIGFLYMAAKKVLTKNEKLCQLSDLAPVVHYNYRLRKVV